MRKIGLAIFAMGVLGGATILAANLFPDHVYAILQNVRAWTGTPAAEASQNPSTPRTPGQTLPVVDESPADSPLHFSGVVIYNGNNTQCAVAGRNDCSSRIVAWVAELRGVKALFVQDLFFYNVGHISLLARELGLEDGMYDREPRYVDTGMLCFSLSIMTALRREPSMRIKVRLVQFEGDSVWGDRAAIKELAFQRRDTINFLRSLQSAPNLNKVLAEPNYGSREDGYGDRIMWDRMRVEAPLHYTSKTREEIVAEIENRLGLAKQHKAWMTALK